MKRLSSERSFHDRQAGERALVLTDPQSLYFPDEAYLDHETWIRPALAQLGDVAGLKVLDLGCGHAMAAVVLARRGAHVTALDLSAGYLAEAARRSLANGVDLQLVQADGERLPFADGSFQRIWGNAILHHLDLEIVLREIRRVLQVGGRAVFCEPWGVNPLLTWARRCLPYRGKRHTPDEQPLDRRHLPILRRVFPDVAVQGFQLLSMARRVLGAGQLVRGLDWCDGWLLRRLPRLQQFCRYVVFTLPR